MEILPVSEGKKAYFDLLLQADEQESMIDRYLDRGEMFLLLDCDEAIGVCVVTDEGNGIFELKNIAIRQDCRRKGYGTMLVNFVCRMYQARGDTLLVGTGDSVSTISFYERCGFMYSHRVTDFFVLNYDHPIWEDGKQLRDMVYLKKCLK